MPFVESSLSCTQWIYAYISDVLAHCYQNQEGVDAGTDTVDVITKQGKPEKIRKSDSEAIS